MKSNINISAIARTAACFGVKQLLCFGHNSKLIAKIARDAASPRAGQQPKKERQKDTGQDANLPRVPEGWFKVHNTPYHPLRKLKETGYQLIGLEQTTSSKIVWDFTFQHKTVLVIGNETKGIGPDIMSLLDAVIEIPVYALPFSFNVATAAAIAINEYCKQFRNG
jgi:tRNA G18 (ribose-2'-O)-methylase SpoU